MTQCANIMLNLLQISQRFDETFTNRFYISRFVLMLFKRYLHKSVYYSSVRICRLKAFHLNALTKLIINKRPAQVTHTKDISIHFHTSRDSGVLFTTSKEANNDYIKAYVDNGHVHVDLFFERAGDRCDLLLSPFLSRKLFSRDFSNVK